ncbi:MAG: transpeptidase family protein [Cryomorphaceae bacterium]|nr:transpeptidase family protein [Cryomorphaceae bacterium]
MKAGKDIIWRVYLVYFGFIALMILVIVETVSIQFGETSQFFSAKSENKTLRPVIRVPRRGEILDVHMTPLVTSVSSYDIYMDPMVVDQKTFDAEVSELAEGLSALFKDRSAHDYEQMIRTSRERKSRYLLIRKKVSNEVRRRLRNLPIFSKGRLKGGLIDNLEIIERKRPNGELLRRTLGSCTVVENVGMLQGVKGLEQAFDTYLRGEPGEEIEQLIPTGWKKTGQITREAVEGADLITSIDKDIQEVASSELERQLREQKARNGCVVVMDVKTGFIRAISNLARREDGSYGEQDFNFAIGRKEVPGSTFKLASLMAALEDDKISIMDTVDAFGTYRFVKQDLKDAHEGGYGRITIKKAFEKSSNVIAKVINRAYGREPEAFIQRLESFGLTEPLGLDLEGEPAPTIHRPGTKQWNVNSLPWMSIGYEVLQTPLQTLAFYNSVANEGNLMKPQFVQEIRRGVQLVKRFQPITLKKRICSDNTLQILRSCLEGVMTDGTGKNITSSQFKIAGKTGTAQILNEEGKYGAKGQKTYQASFVGYFPADKPIYSCIVVITAPTKDIYGATVSGTVFTAIANKVYASALTYHKAVNEGKKLTSNIPEIMGANRYDLLKAFKFLKIDHQLLTDAEWLRGIKGNKKLQIRAKTIYPTAVPNLVGMNVKDAVYLIESRGMNAQVHGYGKVVKQSIAAGSVLYRGGVIELILEHK